MEGQLKVADYYVNLRMFIKSNIVNIDAFGGVMKTSSLRHKHVQLDQRKLNRALRILGARTETEALDRALTVVVSEDKIDTALRKARGKGRIRKVFK
jgi:Arc/MetJ family transcription regulator